SCIFYARRADLRRVCNGCTDWRAFAGEAGCGETAGFVCSRSLPRPSRPARIISCPRRSRRAPTSSVLPTPSARARPPRRPPPPRDRARPRAVADESRRQGGAHHPPGARPYHILALSGGGLFGAYGVGVLTGWSEAGTRPTFDVVTGVSTGALMATFAFLGSEY